MGRRNKNKAQEEVVEGQLPKKHKLEPEKVEENEPEPKSGVHTNFVGSKTITICMPCPEFKVTFIIGKKGIVVGEIRKLSGCKIIIEEQLKKNLPRPVHLTGSIAQLSVGMKLIKEVIDAPKGAVLSWFPQKPDEQNTEAAAASSTSEKPTKKEKSAKRRKLTQAEKDEADNDVL